MFGRKDKRFLCTMCRKKNPEFIVISPSEEIYQLCSTCRRIARYQDGDKISDCSIHELSNYNSEVARGIVHTNEWKQRMTKFQDAFDKSWARKEN